MIFEHLLFNKIKISLYKDNNEIIYFIFYATNNSLSWINFNNFIDSSYTDIFYYQKYYNWTINGSYVLFFFFFVVFFVYIPAVLFFLIKQWYSENKSCGLAVFCLTKKLNIFFVICCF